MIASVTQLRSLKLLVSVTKLFSAAAPTKRKEKRCPPIPGRVDRPVMGLMSNKNFVSINAVEAILSRPANPSEPELWTQKKSYGRIPKYLAIAKDKLKQEKLVVEDYLRRKEKEEVRKPTHLFTTFRRKSQLMHQPVLSGDLCSEVLYLEF